MPLWCKLTIVATLCLLTSVSGTAQRTFVREFKTAAILLATGDTVQGSVLMHCNQDILEIRNAGQAVRLLPAASIRLLAVSQETLNQAPREAGTVNKNATSKKRVGGEKQSNNHEMTSFQVISDYSGHRLNGDLTPSAALMPQSAGALPLYVESQRRGQKLHGKQLHSYMPDSTKIILFRTYKLNKGLEASVDAPAFFEQLTNGPVLLLRRQELYNQLHDNLYIVEPNAAAMATALQLHHPRRQLFALFAAHTQQLEQYAKANQLNLLVRRQ